MFSQALKNTQGLGNGVCTCIHLKVCERAYSHKACIIKYKTAALVKLADYCMEKKIYTRMTASILIQDPNT